MNIHTYITEDKMKKQKKFKKVVDYEELTFEQKTFMFCMIGAIFFVVLFIYSLIKNDAFVGISCLLLFLSCYLAETWLKYKNWVEE